MASNREYYKILIVGPTGKGKTTSFEKMSRVTTGFINVENKPLGFDEPFKYHARPKRFAGVMKALQDYADNPEINVIILDSLSATFEILVQEMRVNFSGYEIWGNYNKQISELFSLIKRIEKEVFVTAHYEILNQEGSPEKRVKVKGKEWEGQVEREIMVVLYAQDRWKDERPEYFFKLAGEGTSAKCPTKIRKMFGEDVYTIPNDSNMVLDKVVEFALKSATNINQ
jgi:hypothetical protein